LRGITASDNGQRLYIADYEMGITVLDLESRVAQRLAGPDTLNFGGIEGLEYWNGHLVMIQNGNEPQRVMRLALSADGGSVEGVAPLAIAQPIFNYPNFGTINGAKLVFFANSHWVRDLTSPTPIQVASTFVDAPPDLISPDFQKFWDEYYESQGIEPPDEVPGGP
ncbi:MAG: hypothetical protein AAGH19_00125, partial [Pseudomonadota bacterium]